MTGPDDEFDDFLARRKPVFRRPGDDSLEPPAELDRIVLRQAREAIRPSEPEPVYHGSRWGVPVAMAATVLIAVSVLLHVISREPVSAVTVQSVAEHESVAADSAAAASEAPAAAPSQPMLARREAVPGVQGGLVSREEATRYAAPPPPSPPVTASTSHTADAQTSPAGASTAQAPAADSARVAGSPAAPAFRRDTRTWLAEIERLRAEGKTAQADLEQAEFNREHRALAVAPDR